MVFHKLVQTMMQVTLATLYPCHTGPASNARQIPDDLRIQTLATVLTNDIKIMGSRPTFHVPEMLT